MTTTTEPALTVVPDQPDIARRPAAVESALAVCREIAHDARRSTDFRLHAEGMRELRGARRVLVRLASCRYMATGYGSTTAVLDRWDHSRVVPGTSGMRRSGALALAAEQNALSAAELDRELHDELAALDRDLYWLNVL